MARSTKKQLLSESVARRLAELRVASAVTMNDLSARTGISVLALHRKFSRNHSEFTIDEAASVAEALGMSPWMAFVDAAEAIDGEQRYLHRTLDKA